MRASFFLERDSAVVTKDLTGDTFSFATPFSHLILKTTSQNGKKIH